MGRAIFRMEICTRRKRPAPAKMSPGNDGRSSLVAFSLRAYPETVDCPRGFPLRPEQVRNKRVSGPRESGGCHGLGA